MGARRLAAITLALLAGVTRAEAHPVAQGSVELELRPRAIAVRLRVAVEEVFVASTLAGAAPRTAPLDELWREHGAYVVAHVHVYADGKRLTGEIRSVTPPDAGGAEFVVYDLWFPLPEGVPGPARVRLDEDLLRDVEFAPGNPWEATFSGRVLREGRVVREAVLLTATQPIEWSATDEQESGIAHARIVREYVQHGIRHILGGWDHLLFMAGLVLAMTGVGDLIAVVTTFTVAHTITLSLATFRVVSVSSRAVEPMIAISIVAVAAQNLIAPRSARGWPRLVIAFGFGLFHGLGFAGGLLAAMQTLPTGAIVTSIAGFSIGVEVGHQLVVLPLFGSLVTLRGRDARRRRATLAADARRIGSAIVAIAGAFYLVRALRQF